MTAMQLIVMWGGLATVCLAGIVGGAVTLLRPRRDLTSTAETGAEGRSRAASPVEPN